MHRCTDSHSAAFGTRYSVRLKQQTTRISLVIDELEHVAFREAPGVWHLDLHGNSVPKTGCATSFIDVAPLHHHDLRA
jgi:hypothetical protein